MGMMVKQINIFVKKPLLSEEGSVGLLKLVTSMWSSCGDTVKYLMATFIFQFCSCLRLLPGTGIIEENFLLFLC